MALHKGIDELANRQDGHGNLGSGLRIILQRKRDGRKRHSAARRFTLSLEEHLVLVGQAERDAANRQLSLFGEQFVYDLERYRLNSVGRDDLAQKVEWVPQTIGDGLGYDIES